jgi:hypothetical protein
MVSGEPAKPVIRRTKAANCQPQRNFNSSPAVAKVFKPRLHDSARRPLKLSLVQDPSRIPFRRWRVHPNFRTCKRLILFGLALRAKIWISPRGLRKIGSQQGLTALVASLLFPSPHWLRFWRKRIEATGESDWSVRPRR